MFLIVIYAIATKPVANIKYIESINQPPEYVVLMK